MVELFNFRKADVYYWLAIAAGIEHFRQLVQGLGTEDHVDIRCSFANSCAFLTCHAATDGDLHAGLGFLQAAPAAQLVKHFLLCLLANRAGIEQQQVSIRGIIDKFCML